MAVVDNYRRWRGAARSIAVRCGGVSSYGPSDLLIFEAIGRPCESCPIPRRMWREIECPWAVGPVWTRIEHLGSSVGDQ